MTDEVLKKLNIEPNSVNFTVSIVSPRQIRKLNVKYRGKNKATDVLSFPSLDITAGQLPTREDFPLDYNQETGKVELGDIVVNKKEKDKDALIEHGLLHLLGYHHDDHKDEEDE